MGNRIYGCDDCLAICPWNKFAQISAEVKLKAREDLNTPRLAELAMLGEQGFRQHFSGSPIKRIGWSRFLRNVLYAIGNSGEVTLLPTAITYVTDSNPIIAEAANWAIHRIQSTS